MKMQPSRGSKTQGGLSGSHNPSRRFEDACAEIQANVKKHVQNIATDLSDEESSEGEVEERDSSIISNVLNKYAKSTLDLTKTEEIIKDSLRSGIASCLICISSVKKSDPIWSCSGCYCILHLSCIQRWAKDSIFFQTEAAAERLSPHEVVDPRKFCWCCPKCRAEYPQPSIPTCYFCYCGKVANPAFDPWLVPHSCGATCGKLLKSCSHSCLLLCHPGPCPPCPQMVSVTCHCSKSVPKMQRCCSQAWSCGKSCSRLLSCGQHRCELLCHSGDCSPCYRTSVQKCLCGATSEKRPCDAIKFQCDKVCGRGLKCGHHTCEVVCHAKDCPPCPRSLQRTCPCGKNAVVLPCTSEVATCGDTCGKLLECGIHECVERCHKSSCGTCLQMRTRRCRCGLKEKELPCYKEFHCESKCKKLKDCRRHPCNRKCCTGTCPPCDQPCNRSLGCKNHKCPSRCHQGPCYPCTLTVSVTCACGRTAVQVPCGSERHTKPPKCSLLCKKPPDCHHAARSKHVCHFGRCPPCQQPCDKISALCGHICKAPCHTSVLVRVDAPQVVRVGPWEPKQAPRMEVKQLPCPPCNVPVPVTCLGAHETANWPCHMAIPSSCGRPCGRPLTCTNHTCSKPCHSVSKDKNNCETCELECAQPRPNGCPHPCKRSTCHAGSCPSCTKLVKRNCYCGLNPQLIRCNELVAALASDQAANLDGLLSCKDQCPKLLRCGHRCPLTCHGNNCPSEAECTTSVQVTCLCKRIKRSLPCSSSQKQKGLNCDDVCQRKKEQELKVKAEKERVQREEEERRNRIELEQFQRKFEKRRKDRRRDELPAVEASRPFYIKVLIVAVSIAVALMAFLWIRV